MNAARALTGDLKAERHRYKTPLPDYTRGEEITNMVTHIVGGVCGMFFGFSLRGRKR